jgi:DNA adenine methylase
MASHRTPIAPDLVPVEPVNPLAGYIGGKRRLAAMLTGKIASLPHGVYAEPFVGMGGIFFRRAARPRVEAVNDISRDVATLFRVLQRHYQAFLDMLKWQVASRAEFERLIAVPPDTLTDLERAARFLYLQKLAFGGKVVGRTFGIATSHPARFDLTRLVPVLEAVHERLCGVYIECLPWQAFIERWDRPETLFFLDPPYWGSEDFYGPRAFSQDQFAALADCLRSIRGRFVLTLNDVPEIRELFSWANIEAVSLSYTVSGASTAAREVVISSPSKPLPAGSKRA